jgi:NAD(P)-dependent dehydrogenase (short-subunit alcohol dehydrogenase family)
MQDKTKIALVTGSSRGLGKNTALALAKKRVGAIVTYLNSEAEAKSVVSEVEAMGGKAVALQLDTGNINFKGVFFLTQKLLPLLKDGGRIVNLSSFLTRIAYPRRATYASMKGAIEVLA